MTAEKTDLSLSQVGDPDNSTLHENVISDKPVATQIEERGPGYLGGVNIGRQLTDDSLHVDHPINISRLRKNLILVTLAWSGFLANYSASKSTSTCFGTVLIFLIVRRASDSLPADGKILWSHTIPDSAVHWLLFARYRRRPDIL